MTKKLYLNQYQDRCSTCEYKAENKCGSGKVSFTVYPGQLYCSELDEFLDIDRLKTVAIFCDKGRKNINRGKDDNSAISK